MDNIEILEWNRLIRKFLSVCFLNLFNIKEKLLILRLISCGIWYGFDPVEIEGKKSYDKFVRQGIGKKWRVALMQEWIYSCENVDVEYYNKSEEQENREGKKKRNLKKNSRGPWRR